MACVYSSHEDGSFILIARTTSLREPSQTTITLQKPVSSSAASSQSTDHIITSLSFDRSQTLVQVIHNQSKIRIKSGDRFAHIELNNDQHIEQLVAQFPHDWKVINKCDRHTQPRVRRTTTLAVPPAFNQSSPLSQYPLARRASLPAPPNATQPLARPASFPTRASGPCTIPEAVSQVLPALASQQSAPEPDTQEEEVGDGGIDLAGLSAVEFEEVVAGVVAEEGFVALVERVKGVLGM